MGVEAKFDDFSLRLPRETDGAMLMRTIREALREPDALRLLPISKRWLDGLKFSDCLPEELAVEAARGRVRVSEGAVGVILNAG